jgi:hypothetical protein
MVRVGAFFCTVCVGIASCARSFGPPALIIFSRRKKEASVSEASLLPFTPLLAASVPIISQ